MSKILSKFNIFVLTAKFRHYLRMNATSYYKSYIDLCTLITYTSYITYIYNYTTCNDYFNIIDF